MLKMDVLMWIGGGGRRLDAIYTFGDNAMW
jgi:hypothetical protein